MTFGIDVYDRYQDITNLLALQQSPFDWAYVKGTDGGGRAPVRADEFVRLLKPIMPVGLYHYAQLSPTPEAQANVLADEVARLKAYGLPPALDLEDPHPAAYTTQAFALRFLLQLKVRGFPRVGLYANTSMLNAIRAWELDAKLGGGLLIWAADYGGNDADYDDEDRQRLARRYPHPVWIHQYSSTGSVPGIPGNVDKNWMFGDPTGDDDMPTVREFWEDYRIQVLNQDGSPVIGSDGKPYQVSPQEILAQNNRAVWGASFKAEAVRQGLEKFAAETNGMLAGLREAVAQLASEQDVDMDAVYDAAKRGAREGVESATVDVDVNIAGRTQFDTPGDTPDK